jgi:ABC-type transporter Mla subunit MlaD
MPAKKRNELAAGIFVTAAVAVTLGVILWLGAADVFKPAGQKVYFYTEEATGGPGIETGSFVLVGGARVGKIVDIRLDLEKPRTIYVARLERGDIVVHSDGQARIATGLVGAGSLVITSRGTDKAPLADAEHPILATGGLDMAMNDISAAAANVKKVSEYATSAAADVSKITTALGKEVDQSQSKSLMAKIHGTIDNLLAMATDARPKVDSALTSVQDMTKRLDDYTKTDVAEILVKMRQASTEILKISKDFSDISGTTREVILVNRDNIDSMLDNMSQVAANLKSASKEIRRNPWRLLYQPKPGELQSQNIYDAARAFSDGAEQLDAAVAKLSGLSKANPSGIPANDPEYQKIREQLQDTFTKFNKVEQTLWNEVKK